MTAWLVLCAVVALALLLYLGFALLFPERLS